jgi:hypothetical protein
MSLQNDFILFKAITRRTKIKSQPINEENMTTIPDQKMKD